jgi:hypothetical protein
LGYCGILIIMNKQILWYLIVSILTIFIAKAAVSAQTGTSSISTTYEISAQHWAMPRQAESLTNLPPLARVISRFRNSPPGSHLLIRYPGGDEGSLWLNELKSWLVALGIGSKDMELVPGSSQQTVIELEVIENNNDISGIGNNNRDSMKTGVEP